MPTIPFQKGYDPRRNTKGRPPSQYQELQTKAQEVLGEDIEADGQPIPAIVAILRGMRDKALGGDTKATEILLLAAYGRPPTKCDVEVERGVEVGLLSSAECRALLAELAVRGMEVPAMSEDTEALP